MWRTERPHDWRLTSGFPHQWSGKRWGWREEKSGHDTKGRPLEEADGIWLEYFFFKLKDNCFTMLCWFLLYINEDQPSLYMYIPSFLSLSPSILPSHLSRSLQSTRLGSLCYTSASHQLSILHMIVHMCQGYFLYSSFPSCVHKSIVYMCIPISSTQTGSLVLFF